MSRSRPAGSATTAAAVAMVVAAVMIAQHIAAIATRDAFFLTQFPATDLPRVMVAAALLSLVVVLAMSKMLTRLSPARAVPVVFLISAGLFAGEWALSYERPRAAAIVAFLHTAAFGAAVISGFWSVIAERFDPYVAKRYIGRIGSGASLGGILGGVLAWQVGGLVSLPVMLAGLGAVNVICAAGVWRLGAGAPVEVSPPGDGAAPSGYRVLREVPYLRHLAALVVLTTIAEVTVDYVFKARAAGELTGDGSLIQFFALFYTATGVLGFAVQLGLVSTALRRLGLTGTIVTYPIGVVGGAVIALLFPGLWSVTALRGGDATLKSSLFRSGYELLYMPLTVDKKRPTKTFVDVGCSRLGGATGSGIAILAIAVAPALAESALLAVALGAAAVAALVVSLLHRGYVAALADSLRSGAVKLDEVDLVDSVSLKTFAETTASMKHGDLMARMDEVRRQMGVRRLGAGDDAPPDIAALTSGDPDRLRPVLAAGLRNEVVSFAIPLLAREDLQREVIEALRVAAPRAIGQLVDAMLDDGNPEVVRRRVPRVLSTCTTQRAADGLVQGLASDLFELRRRCAAALKRIVRKNGALQVPAAPVFAAVRRDARNLRDPQRLDHVFTLLSIVLDPEPAELAFRALRGEGNLRGVGLEYLDNVLPPDVRDALWPHLPGTTAAGKAGRRARADIEAELRSSMAMDLEEIHRELAKGE